MVDPLAKKYFGITPYNYVANNPIILIDPTGMKIEWNDDIKKEDKKMIRRQIKYWKKNSSIFKQNWKGIKKSKFTYTIEDGGRNPVAEFDPNEKITISSYDEESGEASSFEFGSDPGGTIYFNISGLREKGADNEMIADVMEIPVTEELTHAAQYDFWVKKIGSNNMNLLPGKADREMEAKTIVGMIMYQAGKEIKDYGLGDYIMNNYGRNLFVGKASIKDYSKTSEVWWRNKWVQQQYGLFRKTNHDPLFLNKTLLKK